MYSVAQTLRVVPLEQNNETRSLRGFFNSRFMCKSISYGSTALGCLAGGITCGLSAYHTYINLDPAETCDSPQVRCFLNHCSVLEDSGMRGSCQGQNLVAQLTAASALLVAISSIVAVKGIQGCLNRNAPNNVSDGNV
ncbi:MAG: hypothetical protein JHC93_04890 [Parachlamydiales bacterium]|nr:hypothetical protein [Parachlamydiales bacterium]